MPDAKTTGPAIPRWPGEARAACAWSETFRAETGVVELAETEEIFTAPQHPYAAALLSAVSEPDPGVRSRRIFLEGKWQIPSASSPGWSEADLLASAPERA